MSDGRREPEDAGLSLQEEAGQDAVRKGPAVRSGAGVGVREYRASGGKEAPLPSVTFESGEFQNATQCSGDSPTCLLCSVS